MDLKTTFLNGLIEEEVLIEKAQGFNNNYKKTHVYRLKKELYGLKKAPRAWYGRINGFLMRLGFTKCKSDSNLYYNIENDGVMILLLYVDDLVQIGEDNPLIECKKKLVLEFEMKDIGMMH